MSRIVVMGPSGAGKSVVGVALAARLGMRFADADALHPAANVAKMSAGVPLDDGDRMPWLDVVAQTLSAAEEGLVMACSALARRYRERIVAGAADVVFVELVVPTDDLAERMATREHFMPPSLLTSQLRTLEPLAADEPGIRVVNTGPLDEVVERIVAGLAAR